MRSDVLVNLVLIGLRGTGKSTVGLVLSQRLEWPLFDSDAIVQERAGATIRELFEQGGEALFRQWEAEIVQEVAGRDKAVIACGGGAILDLRSVAALKGNGFVAHLSASPAELWRRISLDRASGETRPRLDASARSGLEELQRLMLARAAAYADARDVEVDVEARSPDEVADAILVLMKAHGVRIR